MGKGSGMGGRAEGVPVKEERMANLELLRCVAMMMVVALHYLGKGGLLADLAGDRLGAGETAAWLLESFCIVAVNGYMFISGYFLCMSSFKPSRLIGLWLQLWAYSVAFGLIGAFTGVLRETAFDTHYLLTLLFPVSMGHYWFMTAYVFLYLLLPFIGVAARRMSRQQLQISVGLLLVAFCLVKSVFPVRFEMDGQGYDCLWYVCVFLAAACVRRFGCGLFRKKWAGPGLYGGCCLLIFGGTFLLRAVYLRTGSLETMLSLCMEYNHLLPFLAALGLFATFYRMKVGGRAAKWINRVAPYTLGVYLLHENLGLRYTWQDWLGAGRAAQAMGQGGPRGVAAVFLWTIVAATAVFICGVLTDMLRKRVFDILHRILMKVGLYRRLIAKIGQADEIFRAEAG